MSDADLTARQAADYLGIPVRTFYDLKLPHYHYGRRCNRWAMSDLEEYKTQNPPRVKADDGAIDRRNALVKMTADEIMAKAVSLYRGAGVYFLIKDRVIVYVGKSINVAARVGQHIRDGKDFDALHVIEADAADIHCAEQYYIIKLSPLLNKAGVPFGRNKP